MSLFNIAELFIQLHPVSCIILVFSKTPLIDATVVYRAFVMEEEGEHTVLYAIKWGWGEA